MSLNHRIVFFAVRATLLAASAHGPPPLPAHPDFSAGTPAGVTSAPGPASFRVPELRLAREGAGESGRIAADQRA